MFWCYEAYYPVKIHKLAALLFKLQGSKLVKKVAAYYSVQIMVITALLKMCLHLVGHTLVVELLLDHKSNIEHRNKAGCTPLMLAAR